MDVPLDHILSAQNARSHAARIRMDRALPFDAPAQSATPPVPDPDTSFVAVVDRWGNAFSATPSDASYDSPVVPGLGLIPSNRGCQSRPDPRHPAGVAPGKRPRLTPNPAILVTAEGGAMPFGTPGGDVQVQAMLQVAYGIHAHGMDAQAAVDAPRIASYAAPSSFAPFAAHGQRLAVEAGIPDSVRDELRARGHDVHPWPAHTWLAGAVQVVLADPARGLVHAAADTRRPAAAIAG